MLEAVRVLLGLLLLAAAGLKLAAPRSSQASLATFGVGDPRTRWAVWALIVAAEISLGVAVALGFALATYAAAAMLLGFALVQAVALARGSRGEPCGCFGPTSRLGPAGVGRDLVLAVALAALPALPGLPSLGISEWLGLGVGVSLLAIAGLTIAVAALAREVGVLRLALAPQSALEIAHEGPELGGRAQVIQHFDRPQDTSLAVAVFTSKSCRLCQALEPSVAFLGDDPLIDLRVFDEDGDRDVWEALDVPGSPYAVALDLDGIVLAKGTFNSLGQLESVLSTAEHRRRQAAHAA